MLSNKQKDEAIGKETQRFFQYDQYKNSGIEWLGKIPTSWDHLRLRHACTYISDGSHYSPASVMNGYPYVTVRDLKEGKIDVSNAARISQDDFTELERNGCRPRIGDVIFSKDGTIGKVALVERNDFVILSSLAILRPGSKITNQFLKYFLVSSSGIDQIKSKFAGAALRRITLDVIADLVCCTPPLHEQHKIASFLDRETAKIDALIAKKQRLIELLREKRISVITHAVTRGINREVTTKVCGIDFLGEIPSKWQVVSLKRLGLIKYGLGEPPRELVEGLPLIRATNVSSGLIVEQDMIQVDPLDVPWERDPILRKDDIIVVRSGAYTGDSAIVPSHYDGAIAGYDMVFRAAGAYPQYVAWTLLSRYVLESQIKQMCLRAAQPHLNKEELGSVLIALPEYTEQQQISSFLKRETEAIDRLVASISDGVSRLYEYRTALISAAVTGKIDVRGEAPNSEEVVDAD